MAHRKYTRLYNIQYQGSNTGPAEFLLDWNQFAWIQDVPTGPMHLNTIVAKAVKEVTGLDIISCKFDTSETD